MKRNTFIGSTIWGNGGKGTGCLVVWSVGRGGAFLWKYQTEQPRRCHAKSKDTFCQAATSFLTVGHHMLKSTEYAWDTHTLGRCPPGQFCRPGRAGHTYSECGEHVDAREEEAKMPVWDKQGVVPVLPARICLA